VLVVTYALRMRRIFLAAVTLILAPALAWPAPQRDGNGSLRAQATALFDKAATVTDLAVPGGLPYHLREHIKTFAPKRPTTESTHEFWWIASGRWREEITTNGSTGVWLSDSSRSWEKATDEQKLIRYRVGMVRAAVRDLRLLPEERVKKIATRQIDGAAANCIESEYSPPGPPQLDPRGPVYPPKYRYEICLDAASGLLLLKRHDLLRREYEYGDYTALGLRRAPQLMRYLFQGKPVLEMRVDVLEFLDKPDVINMTPPLDAALRGPCKELVAARPVSPGVARGDLGLGILLPGNSAMISVLLRIDPQGRVSDYRIMESEGPSRFSSGLVEALRQAHFQPATCDGQPTDWETVFEFGYRRGP
jgi:TonB family protein